MLDLHFVNMPHPLSRNQYIIKRRLNNLYENKTLLTIKFIYSKYNIKILIFWPALVDCVEFNECSSDIRLKKSDSIMSSRGHS